MERRTVYYLSSHRWMTGVIAGACFAVTALVPGSASALDITSYVAATVNFSKAGNYKENGDMEAYETAHKRALLWLAGGLACDAVTLVIIAASADRVERLEAEVANGGGPITDAYATAFGLSQGVVFSAVRESLSTDFSIRDAQEFDANLLGRLIPQGHLTDEMATRILYGLYQERLLVGMEKTPWHQTLSDLTGVPSTVLVQSIAEPIDSRLHAAEVPGSIVSARSALAQDSLVTLYAVLDHVYGDHETEILARIDELTGTQTDNLTPR